MKRLHKSIVSFILLTVVLLSTLAGNITVVKAEYNEEWWSDQEVNCDVTLESINIPDYSDSTKYQERYKLLYWGTCEIKEDGTDFSEGKDTDYVCIVYDTETKDVFMYHVTRDKALYKEPNTFIIKNVNQVKYGLNLSSNTELRIHPSSFKSDSGTSNNIKVKDYPNSTWCAVNKKSNYNTPGSNYYENLRTNSIINILTENIGLSEGTIETLLCLIINKYINMDSRYEDNSELRQKLSSLQEGDTFTVAARTYVDANCTIDLKIESIASSTGDGIDNFTQVFLLNGNALNSVNDLFTKINSAPDKTKYPILYEFYRVYHDWQKTDEERNKENQEMQAAELLKEVQQLDESSSLFDCYAWLIRYYASNAKAEQFYRGAWEQYEKIAKDGTNTISILSRIHCRDIIEKSTYDVTWDADDRNGIRRECQPIKVDNNLGSNSRVSVTEEQLLRLRIMYYVALNSRSTTPQKFDPNKYLLSPLKTLTLNADKNNGSELLRNGQQAVTDTKSFELDQLGTISSVTAINVVEELTRYLMPIVLGYEVVDDGATESLPTSEILSVLIGINSDNKYIYSNRIGVMWNLPKFRNIKEIANKQSAYWAYANLQLLYLAMEDYVYDKVEIEDGKWVTGETILANDDIANDAKRYQSVINALVKIHGALDNLGIRYTGNNSEVSERMTVFMSYYGKLAAYYESNYTDSAMNMWNNSSSALDPFKAIFTLDDDVQYMTTDYLTGVKLSASYIPMRTNLYNLSSLNELDDPDWISRFHYGYGFYRKALFIDTNQNAAVERYAASKGKGITKVATLRDLLSTERDIVLYVDDSYYNLPKLEEQLNGFQNRNSNVSYVYTDKKEEDNSDDTIKTKLFSDSVTLDLNGLAKTNGKKNYSSAIKAKIGDELFTSDEGMNKDQDNTYVMGSREIIEYLNVNSNTEKYHDEYSVAQSFAVVSAIYRQNRLYEIIKSESSNPYPVFISSPTLWRLDGIAYKEFLSVYNYLMLKNLEAQLGIDYESTMDLDAPLYIDIYGNILTESGLVVIPAACNPTLYTCNSMATCQFNTYTAGFLTYYNNGQFYIPNISSANKYVKESFMYLDSKTDTYRVGISRFKTNGTNTKLLDFRNINVNNSDYLQMFMKQQERALSHKALTRNQHYYLITEVLRGAPVEEIDKEQEHLTDTGYDPSGFEIYVASKLESLVDQMLPIQNGNTWITLPNLAFMENVEYVFLFIFKLIMVGLVVLLVYRIYRDAVDGVLGIKALFSFALSCAVVLMAMFSVPYFMDLSYYQVNKRLLQSEVSYIEMLNIEKMQEGREIGLTSINTPESATELYLKVDDVSIPWYNLIDDILFHPTNKTISEAYDAEFDKSLMANLPGMVKKGNGIYIPLSIIYNQSVISYDLNYNLLESGVTETPYASYITPYYMVLEHLIQIINAYNQDPNLDGDTEDAISKYETVLQANGITRTKGLITSYFLSNEFMLTERDVTGFKTVYDRPVSFSRLDENNNPTINQVERIQRSDWYRNLEDKEALDSKIDEIEKFARDFVLENKAVLGKITDEAFLKVMAMSIAVKHNDLLGSRNGNAIEIYDVDARDIIRLSIADKPTVLKDSVKSFSRFVFTNGGALGVILTVVLVCVYFISSLVKPLCIAIMLIVMMASLVARRFVKREGMTAIEGYIITLAILCGTNALYALVLKDSILLANTGLSTLISVTIQIAIQCIYLFCMVSLTKLVITNWETMGFDAYAQSFQKVTNFITNHTTSHTTERYHFNRAYRHGGYDERYERDKVYLEREDNKKRRDMEPSLVGLSAEEYRQLLNGRDERRRENRGRK